MKVWLLVLAFMAPDSAIAPSEQLTSKVALIPIFWKFCDQNKMSNYRVAVFDQIIQTLENGNGHYFFELFTRLSEHSQLTKSTAEKFVNNISNALNGETLKRFYLAYISVKVKMMIFFSEKYIDQKSAKSLKFDSIFNSEISIDFDVSYKSFKSFILSRFKNVVLDKSSLASIHTQLSVLSTISTDEDTKKILTSSIRKISEVLCKIRLFLRNQGTAPAQLTQEQLDYLKEFFRLWISFNNPMVIQIAINEECKAQAKEGDIPKGEFLLQTKNFPFDLETSKKDQIRTRPLIINPPLKDSTFKIAKLENSLIHGSLTDLSDPGVIEALIYKYRPNKKWTSFITGGKSLKIMNGNNDISEEDYYNVYMLIHKIFLFMLEHNYIVHNPDISIHLQVIEFLSKTDCWVTTMENKKFCLDLIQIFPPASLSKYFYIILFIFEKELGSGFKEDFVKDIVKLNSKVLLTFADNELANISIIEGGNPIPSRIKITEIVTEKLIQEKIKEIQKNIQELIKKNEDLYYLSDLKSICGGSTLEKLNQIDLAHRISLLEQSTIPELHIFYYLFTYCGDGKTKFADEKKILEETLKGYIIAKTTTTTSNFSGFLLYLQHTMLPKREFSLVRTSPNFLFHKLRFFDYQYLMINQLKGGYKSISFDRMKNQKSFKADNDQYKTEKGNYNAIDYESTKDYRYGHSWFLDIIDIFNFYGSKIEFEGAKRGVVINDLSFTSLFDDLYYSLLRIRAQINTPVLNSKKYLWKYLMKCNEEINNQNFFSETTPIFEGNPGFNPQGQSTCVVEKDKLRTIIYLVFAWLKDDEKVSGEFINFEKSLISTGSARSGLSDLITFLASPKSLMRTSFKNFCQSDKGKQALICIAITFSSGFSEFLAKGSDDFEEFNKHVGPSFVLFKAADDNQKKILRPMILETIFALKRFYSKFNYFKVAIIDRIFIQIKNDKGRWSQIYEFKDDSELVDFYISVTRTETVEKEFTEIADEYLEPTKFETLLTYDARGKKSVRPEEFIEFLLRHGSKNTIVLLLKELTSEQRDKLFTFYVTGPSTLEKNMKEKKQITLKYFIEEISSLVTSFNNAYEVTHLTDFSISNYNQAKELSNAALGEGLGAISMQGKAIGQSEGAGEKKVVVLETGKKVARRGNAGKILI